MESTYFVFLFIYLSESIYISLYWDAVYARTFADASALNDDAACAIAVCVSHDSFS